MCTLAVIASRIRVRFAPSPTGAFHVGGARTALYNWAVALREGGDFVLRIEDTDQERNRPEWTQGIVDALYWLGLHPGTYEGPYLQSERADRHTAAARRLYEAGLAYYCDCTREQVVERTGNPHRGYDGFCRDRGLGPGPGRALRFRTPDQGETVVEDVIRGRPTFPNAALDDFVIARGDGSALYMLAVVVDDVDMGITHVIRGEEHLSNAPKHQLLWQALGAEPPVWAHLPVLVDAQRRKLSKRRDKVALEDYRDEGYLSEAMRNYLMLLGWSPPGGQEVMPWESMVELFRLEQVQASPAFFDVGKLRSLNGTYLRALTPGEFIAACRPWVEGPNVRWSPECFDLALFAAAAPLVQTRAAVLSEVPPLVDFFFLEKPTIEEDAWASAMRDPGPAILAEAIAAYDELEHWEPQVLKDRLAAIGLAHDRKLSAAQAPIRVAVTGRSVGLPLFESLALLGKPVTMQRLRAARERLEADR
ncbi:glutamate--tRNA ligase [Candidatus Nephthysia bennettiae]|uniref:glutamate--tRNA ligase n=1 Tax=Candidatus Nephthysia bennettiae TaxID=3127016 RepID=UPI003312FC4E